MIYENKVKVELNCMQVSLCGYGCYVLKVPFGQIRNFFANPKSEALIDGEIIQRKLTQARARRFKDYVLNAAVCGFCGSGRDYYIAIGI